MSSETAAPVPRPWGYRATLIWLLLTAGVSVVVSTAVLSYFSRASLERSADPLTNGPLLAQITLVSTIVQVAMTALAARLAGWRATEYLGWAVPGAGIALVATAITAVFVLGYDALTYFLHRDVVTSFQTEAYRSAQTAGKVPQLWLSFVILAPLGEELLFRGFLFRGWVQTSRDVVPGIAFISALWAVIHVQYDWFGMLQIFLIGLILGWARWRSGSTLLTFLLHGLINAWAMIETVAALG
jgi:membrane protease YdiL (CAAX protease family)